MIGGFLVHTGLRLDLPEIILNVMNWKQRFKYARLKSNKPTFKFLFRVQSIKTGRIKEG